MFSKHVDIIGSVHKIARVYDWYALVLRIMNQEVKTNVFI